jgi:uncharacterized membrane protein
LYGYFFALLSLLCYSAWGLLNGIAINKSDPFSVLFYSSIGYMISGLIALSFTGFKPIFSYLSFLISFSVGLATGLGGLFLLLAIQKITENPSIIIALTSTYPLVVVLLNYFISDTQHMGLLKIFGCVLSVIGVICITI